MRNCEWCKAEFEPSNADQAYCKPTHSKKGYAKRLKARQALENAGKCPTPYKRAWIDHPNAKNWTLPSSQYLYPCRCGAIHAATHKQHKTSKAAAA
jgi:hypothetical protein